MVEEMWEQLPIGWNLVTIVTRLGRWGNLSPLPSSGGNNPGLPNLELARLTEISELEEPK